jgi:hypothetical protein
LSGSSCCFTSTSIISSGILSGSASGNSELGAIIGSSSLRNRHQNALMVGSGRHGADAVVASGKTSSDGGLEKTLAVSGIIDSLEEGELGWIQGGCRIECLSHILDSHVGVADNLSS